MVSSEALVICVTERSAFLSLLKREFSSAGES